MDGVGRVPFRQHGRVRQVRLGAFSTPAELVFYRGLIGMALPVAAGSAHQGVTLATRYPGMHAWRSLVGVASHGQRGSTPLRHLPLATAMTLNYMSSLWIAAFLLGVHAAGAGAPRSAPPPSRCMCRWC